MQSRRPTVRIVAGTLGLAWLGVVLGTLFQIGEYQNSPGVAAKTGDQWPGEAQQRPAADRPTLVLFAHPHCPCTSATIEELDRLLAACAGRVAVRVCFYSDPELGPEWTHSALWARTARIPGVTVHEDPLGAQARLFGASTSGQALLFAPDGALLFQGGLTATRGHAGDNLGRASVLALLDGKPAPRTSPVFGCSLLTPGAP